MELDQRIEQVKESLLLAIDPPGDQWLIGHYGDYYSPYYSLMYHLASTIKSELSLETGVHNGRGAASLAAGHLDGIVVGVDHQHHPGLVAVQDRFPNFTYINFSSTDQISIDQVTGLRHKIDIMHIDTEHSCGQVWNEFKAYKHTLSETAVILFDDTHAADDSVLKAVYELPLRWQMEVDWLHPICGYAIGIM